MMTPFPYDVVGAWKAKHNIQLSKEACEDLIEQFWTFGKTGHEERLHLFELLSEYALKTTDTKTLDLIEEIQRKVLTNITKE